MTTDGPGQADASLAGFMEVFRRQVQALYRGGSDGMVVVSGWPDSGDPVAFACGVEDETQLELVETVARVMFARAQVRRYAVAMPAWIEAKDGESQEIVAMQVFRDTVRGQCLCRVQRANTGLIELEPQGLQDEFSPWLGDLTQALERVPGRMLRAVQDAYEATRVDIAGLA